MRDDGLRQSDAGRASGLRSVVAEAWVWLHPGMFARPALLFVLYLAAAWSGLQLVWTTSGPDIVWPANGILLAFLLTTPRRNWILYLLASMAANILAHGYSPFAFPDTLVFTACNTVEVLLAALLLAQSDGSKPDFTNLPTLGIFVGGCGLLAPLAATASFGLLHLVVGSKAGLQDLKDLFAGDALGILIMTPLTLAINRDELTELFGRRRLAESLGILALLAAVSVTVFAQNGLPIAFLLIPLLLLAIFRLGISGAAIGVFLMAAPGAYFTALGRGPFAGTRSGNMLEAILLLDCFLWVSILMLYSVSSVLAEKDRLQRQLTDAVRVAETKAGLDHLTGLANRRSFDLQLRQEWYRAAREKDSLSLLMIDVDHFKQYNDQQGHMAGDACLRRVAEVLSSAPLRRTDLVARFGGDEFAVILWRANAQGALELAERLCRTVEEARIPHPANPRKVVTITVGVATMAPSAGLNRTTLIERADEALYCAKVGGRNRVEAWQEAITAGS